VKVPAVSYLGVAGAVAIALLISTAVGLSSLVAGLLLGVGIANLAPLFGSGAQIVTALQPATRFAARRLLRLGVVLLGARLSVDQIRELGLTGAIVMIAVVTITFFGVQILARALGLSPGLGLLTASGFSICGASAVAAVAPVAGTSEDETAYAVGLITLCGTASIFVLPAIGHFLQMPVAQFGAFAGAGVHDVGQVTATAAAFSEDSLATATLVKLTRVMMLAPIVAGIGLWAKSRKSAPHKSGPQESGPQESGPAPALIPLFVAGFLGMIALRASGLLSGSMLDLIASAERVALTAGLFGLGAGVSIRRLRHLGGRPLLLGLASWALIGGLALGASVIISS
jgi:uncharacterized integral membrane protein (TIGR00698 family)